MIVCGTGHRDPLLFFTNETKDNFPQWEAAVRKDLKGWLKKYRPKLVISGGAPGWDTWLFEEAFKLEIETSVYAPWPGAAYDKFKGIAGEFKLCSEKYHKNCYFVRDKAMVDAADLVLALCAPTAVKGGTVYTRDYALDKRKAVINFWI